MSNINLKVLDVSHFNEITSLEKVFAYGIRGIIHKATQGESYADPNYAQTRKGAVAAGFLWGAYHFADNTDPVKQAQHFVNIADPDPRTLMALDFEPNGDSTMTLANARAFMEELERLIGRKAVLYSGNLIKETLGSTKDSFWASRNLWLAEYGPKQILPASWETSGAWLWQFSDGVINRNGYTVPGVTGQVDLNSYAGSDEQLTLTWTGAPIEEPKASASPSLISRIISYFHGSA